MKIPRGHKIGAINREIAELVKKNLDTDDESLKKMILVTVERMKK